MKVIEAKIVVLGSQGKIIIDEFFNNFVIPRSDVTKVICILLSQLPSA